MADLKISQLTAISVLTPATDVLPVVDSGGVTKKITTNQILGSGGTATLASATISGDLTVDTSTLKVDSTNNRVGIGTASPSYTLQVLGTSGSVADLCGSGVAGQQTLLRLRTATGNTNGLLIQGNVSNDEIFINNFYNAALVFGVNNTEGMRLNSTANLILKGGTAGATGVGVTFPATQVASSDANCLDDYEEGTWTGTLKGSTTDPTVPVTATGRYTKIGRQVLIEISFTNVSTVGAAGAISVAMTGLPGVTATRSMGNVSAWLGATFTGTLQAMIIEGTSVITLVSSISNAANGDATHNAGTGRYFWITAIFTV
jgi:hypothetical protein